MGGGAKGLCLVPFPNSLPLASFSRSSSSMISRRLSNQGLRRRIAGDCRLSTAVTGVAAVSASAAKGVDSADSLLKRVVLVGDPNVSIVPVLQKWIEEGRAVEKEDLLFITKRMKSMRRFSHALEISMWMTDKRYFSLSPGQVATRLNMIYKVHGIQQAENFFDSTSSQMRGHEVYGALLSCYVESKSTRKAEAVFEMMRERNLLNSFAYNMRLKLYAQTGELNKVKALFGEMEDKRFVSDFFTCGILMDALVAASDIDGMDALLERLSHQRAATSWYVFAVAGRGYARAGLMEKAVDVLMKSEALLRRNRIAGPVPYGFLLSEYAEMGRKSDTYRLWNMYKSLGTSANSMYLSMISALLKMDDMEAAETVFKEWEASATLYDFRIPNKLLLAYCNNGLLDKAEAFVAESVKSGRKPFANSWDRLAGLYFSSGQTAKAVETMKKALIAGQGKKWTPDPENVASCLRYFEGRNDLDDAEEFLSLLRHLVPLTEEAYRTLLRIYRNTGRPISDLIDRMKGDGFDVDEEP